MYGYNVYLMYICVYIMYDALVASVCLDIWYIDLQLWFETEVIARRDAPPIETEISFSLSRGNESESGDQYRNSENS